MHNWTVYLYDVDTQHAELCDHFYGTSEEVSKHLKSKLESEYCNDDECAWIVSESDSAVAVECPHFLGYVAKLERVVN